MVVRARRGQRARPDTVVKLRPVVPSELSAKLRRQKGFKVELDAMPGGFVCSASFKGRTDADVRKVAAGTGGSAGCSRKSSGGSTEITRRRGSRSTT